MDVRARVVVTAVRTTTRPQRHVFAGALVVVLLTVMCTALAIYDLLALVDLY